MPPFDYHGGPGPIDPAHPELGHQPFLPPPPLPGGGTDPVSWGISFQPTEAPSGTPVAADAYLPVCYGLTRVSGAALAWGSLPGEEQRHGWGVIAWCDGEIDAIANIYCNGGPVRAAYTNDTVAFGRTDYVGASGDYRQDATSDIFCPYPRTHTGTGSAGPYDVSNFGSVAYTKFDVRTLASFPWPSGWWGMGFGLSSDTATIAWTADVRGLKLYDPRLDSTNGGSGSQRSTDPTTWTYANNSALVTRDILRRFGHASNATIDDAAFRAMADACDTNGFTCNITFATPTGLDAALAPVLQTCNGRMIVSGGRTGLYVNVANPSAPVATLSEEDGDIWGITCAWVSARSRFTRLAVSFLNSAADYKPDQTPYQDDPGIALGTVAVNPTVVNAPGINTLPAAIILRDYLFNLQATRFQLTGTANGRGLLLQEGQKVHIITLKGIDAYFLLTQIAPDADGFFPLIAQPYDGALYTSTPVSQDPPIAIVPGDPTTAGGDVTITDSAGTRQALASSASNTTIMNLFQLLRYTLPVGGSPLKQLRVRGFTGSGYTSKTWADMAASEIIVPLMGNEPPFDASNFVLSHPGIPKAVSTLTFDTSGRLLNTTDVIGPTRLMVKTESVASTLSAGVTVDVASSATSVAGSGSPDAASPVVIAPSGVAAGDGGEIQFRELSAGGTNVTGFGAPDSLAADVRYILPDTAPTSVGEVWMWDSTTGGRVKVKWGSVNVEKLVIEVPTGTIDGSNKVFTLSKTPVSANVMLLVDNMPLLYTPTGTTVTIPSAENAPERSIWAMYSEGGTGFTSTGASGPPGIQGPPGPLATGPVMAVEVPTGSINGSNDTFALAHLPTTDVALIADDQKVNDGVDYHRTGTGIVFDALANKPARSLLALYGYASASGSVLGTVSSVSLSVPHDLLSVSGSPIIGTGMFTITLPSRSGNLVFAGPPTAGSSSPTFRSLVSDDIPVLDTSKITSGIFPYARGGTGASTAWTPGAILFAGASAFAQAPSSLFYDAVNNRLGLGTATPLAPWHLVGAARIDGTLTFVGARSISTTSDNLTLSPAADLDLTPGGTARVRVTSGVRLQSDNYASQTTGWGIDYSGAGDFRYLYTDELHAKSFISDLEQALAGGQIISKSVAPLAANFTVPAAGSAATFVVESFKGFDTFRVFVDGDMIRLRQFSRTGTSLGVTDCWGTVVWVSTDSTAKTQTYTFTRSSAPNAGAATTASTIGAGTLALDYGTTGNGFLESNAIDGAMAENAPYHQIVSWAGHPATGLTTRTRLGNLKGIFSVSNEYGLYAGSGITDASQYLRISDQAVEGHNLTIKLYDGAVNTVLLSPSAPSFAMGSTLPTAYGTGAGIWMGKDSSVYKFRVGIPSGQGIFWDGTNLAINGSVTITGISGLNYAAAATPGGAASTLAGQGALATKSSVDLSTGDVTNKSLANVDSTANTKLGGIAAGADVTSANTAAAVGGAQATKLAGIAAGATVGATWGTDLVSIPTTLGTPSGAGLFLSSTYMGYYAASAWKTYIDSSGNMILGDFAGAQGLSWNQGTGVLNIKGVINITAGGNAATTGYADGVGSAAVSTAAGDATTKAGTAQSNAISTAAGDATTKANAAAAASLPLHSTADAALTAANASHVLATAVAAPSGAGLYLGSDYLGYYNASAWKTYMDSSGHFYLSGTGANGLSWDGGALAINGVITATSGTIGGFTITAAELYAGTGVTRVEMQAAGGFWAGATAFSSAPFRVSPAGVLTATSGAIGGWTLGTTYLHDSTGDVGISSEVTTGDDVRFWAGGARDSAPFRVTKAGALVATNAIIGGTIAASDGSVGGWTIGATSLSSTDVVLSASGSGSISFGTTILDAAGIAEGMASRTWASLIEFPLPMGAVANATNATDVITQLNALLSGLRSYAGGALAT